jgi:ribonuclease P protein subunit RPR2
MSVGTFAGRVAPFVVSIGFALERLQMLEALRRREEEIGALRGQLDVYATDFRLTYQAERDRSQELANALAELEKTYRATVRGLAVAVEAKDECTGGHLQRVSRYGMMLTGLVAPEHADDPQFEYGFLLHDIGKLTVPDSVLSKPGSLSDAEWELIRAHPASGHSILDGIPFLAGAREIVYSHHERWDGQGYPRGLAGAQIPLGAQIFPLCDAFDAMTSNRPYRQALPIEGARAEVARGAGSQFWPDAVEAFMSLPGGALESVRDESNRGSA